MTLQYPNYDDCLTGLARSVLGAFGVDAGPGLADCGRLLSGSYKNVVIFLLDGMGTAVLERHLSPDSFLRRHFVRSYSSVFPPTTVAATTSVQSGLEPASHSWLGWDCYYPAVGKNVTVFSSTLQGTDIPAASDHVAWTYCPYNSVVNQINAAGGHAYHATPFADPYPDTLDGICRRMKNLCAQPERKFIYAYWMEPDSTMHELGVDSQKVTQILQTIDHQLEELCKALPDTLVFFTADHGQVDSKAVSIKDYPRILEHLERMPSIEPRALNFYVKKGHEKFFCDSFLQEFGEKFLLLTHEEVVTHQLFGKGEPHSEFHKMLGDYLAIATGDLSIYVGDDFLIGSHAGLTRDEMTIPLIVYKGDEV